ncbi:DNA ligase [Jiangella aurantiaca]|uniref:DNA ligase (ATP) n=2 Tax=Jiangella aurantiaca TaxID=2530373 RepID=A0A4R5A1Y2_9ACTN|nr:DNA ligase [Jiangella aurantiaca]
MAATLAAAVPADDDAWGYEVKWDGVRTIARIRDGRLRLTSRSLRDVTGTYPEIGRLVDALDGRRVMLDGEIVAFDDQGRPSFQQLQPRMNVKASSVTPRLIRNTPVYYMIFDVLYLDGRSLLRVPYEDRRGQLEDLVEADRSWQVPAYVRGSGSLFLEASAQQHLEGIVAKRLRSRYEPGKRTRDWLKIKNSQRQEFVIGGWLEGESAFRGFIGALTVGYYDADGAFRYAGRVGTGMTLAERRRLRSELALLAVDRSPFVGAQPDKPGARFVRPELVCEVAFAEWTREGTLRHPSYKGLRGDKTAGEVVREEPA